MKPEGKSGKITSIKCWSPPKFADPGTLEKSRRETGVGEREGRSRKEGRSEEREKEGMSRTGKDGAGERG